LARLSSDGEAEQVLGGRLIGGGEGEDPVGPAMQIWAALGGGSGQHEPADQARAEQREFLRDVAAEREAEDVDFLQTERVDEGERVASHVGHVVGNNSRRAADAAVVEQDDFATLCEPVDQRRVPAVQVAAEVLEADERRRVRLLVPKRR
jgi:hypothetical protein